jgi:hypothetical protein
MLHKHFGFLPRVKGEEFIHLPGIKVSQFLVLAEEGTKQNDFSRTLGPSAKTWLEIQKLVSLYHFSHDINRGWNNLEANSKI